MADFADKLNSLVSLEISKGALHDPEKMSDIVEKLASSLAFSVALAAHGDPKDINHLLEGLQNYICEAAVERAPLARMIASRRARHGGALPGDQE